MSIKLSELPGDVRAELAQLGRRFGSPDVLAQIDQCANGLKDHQAALAAHGFTAQDAERLAQVEAALRAQLANRAGVREEKKGKTLEEGSLMREGQRVRTWARSVVMSVLEDLQLEGAAQALRAPLVVVLEETRAAPKVTAQVVEQLTRLGRALSAEGLEAAVKARGGEGLGGSLLAQAAALQGLRSARTQPDGTPEETEALDVLDGLAVSLLRRARRAAQAASRATGNRAIAGAFKLSHLY